MPRSPHVVPVALLLVSASALALAAPVPTPRDKRPPHQIEAAQELLAQLKKLAADPKQDVDRLSKLWQQMRLEHGGSPECLAAAAVMCEAPSPLDKLDRNQIPAEDRLPWLPREVVAVVGEHRGRHWDDAAEMAVTPDGRFVLTAADGLRIWDTVTLQEKTYLPGERPMALSPDGKVVAVGTQVLGKEDDNIVRLFNRDGAKLTGRCVLRPKLRAVRRTEEGRWEERAWERRFKEGEGRPFAQLLQFSADGKRLIALYCDQVLRVWDLTGKQPVEKFAYDATVLRGWEGRHAGLFGLRGDLLASSPSSYVYTRLWQVTEDGVRLRVELPDSRADPIALSPDGKKLVTGLKQPICLRLWDISGKKPKVIDNIFDPSLAISAAFSPDGRLLASVHLDRKLRLWPMDEGKRKELGLERQQTHFAAKLPSPGPEGVIACYRQGQEMHFLPDGKAILLNYRGGLLLRFDLDKKALRFEPRAHLNGVHTATFSPDGTTLLTQDADDVTRCWDLSGARPKERALLEREVRGAAFAPQGRYLVTLQLAPNRPGQRARNTLNTLRAWDLSGAEWKETFTSNPFGYWVNDLVFSPDGKWCASVGCDETGRRAGSDNGPDWVVTARLWQFRDGGLGEPILIRPAPIKKEIGEPAHWAVFSPDSRTLIFATRYCIRMWDVTRSPPKQCAVVGRDKWVISSLALSPDGKTLAVTGNETLQMYKGKELTDEVRNQLARKGDEELRRVMVEEVTEQDFQRLWLWDVSGAKPKVRAALPGDWGNAEVMFSPDGRTLASWGHNDRRLVLWDPVTGKERREWRLPGRVRVSFAPDGRHLATANGNGTVYIFRLAKPGKQQIEPPRGEDR